MSRSSRALAVAFLLLLAVGLRGDRFWLQFCGKALITALLAMSLDVLVGYLGLVSLAHAAFFGLSAYALVGLSNEWHWVNPLLTLPACLAVAAAAALCIGWLSLRASGVYFIMVTLAFTQMLHYLFNDQAALGGSDGLYVSARPRLVIAGRTLLDLGSRSAVYFAVLGCAALAYLFLVRMLRAPFGQALLGIRSNEQRMRSLGYPTRRYKLVAFIIAGTLAGLAGWLDAALFGFVNPALFGWRQAGVLLVVVLFGGKGTFHGPALGAFAFALLEYGGEKLTTHWNGLVGLVVMAAVLLLPRGLAGLFDGRPLGTPP